MIKNKDEKNLIVALDVGTSKIVVIVLHQIAGCGPTYFIYWFYNLLLKNCFVG